MVSSMLTMITTVMLARMAWPAATPTPSGPPEGVEAVVALHRRGDPHEDDGLEQRVDDVLAGQHQGEVVQVGARGAAADDPHHQLRGQVADRQARRVQRDHRDHRGHQARGHQVGDGPDGDRLERVDLLGDPHGSQLRGESAPGLGGERQRGGDRRQLAGVDQRGDDAGGGPQAQQVQEVVALDADQRPDRDAEDDRDARRPAADHQGAVAPGDIGEQADELVAVVPQRDRYRGQRPDEEHQHVAEPDEGHRRPSVEPPPRREDLGCIGRCRHVRARPAGTS